MSDHKHITLPYGVLPTDVIDLNHVLGPFFLAHCFNYALYGALVLQVYIYYLRFPKDLTYIKTLVYTVFALDTFFIGCITHAAYTVLVTYWGDVNVLHSLPWTWATLPVGTGVVSCIVQLFFVWRIWKLSRQCTMPIIITLVTLTQCAFALQTGVIAGQVQTFRYIRDFIPGCWLVGSITADILTSATLVRILWKSQTGFKDTDGVVLRLIRLSIEAAAIPVIAASIKLALIYSYHDNRHLIFCVVLGRLYSNCFMAMLNCRDPLFGGGSQPNTMAGAARLSDGPMTVYQVLKSKLTFGGSRASGSEPSTSFGSFERQSYGEKIMVHKSVRSHHDIDLERAIHGGNERVSTYSLASLDALSRTSSHVDGDLELKDSPVMPMSPATAAATTWMRPYSIAVQGQGAFETKSELVGHDGRSLMVQTPIAEHPAAGSANSDFFPGR